MAAAVGRYELVRAIGRGGMAEVFLARRRGAAGIHKRLVVKRVRQDLTSDPRFAEMFLREARVATALSHQNIVTVFDVGRDDEGLFLAMDYVDGPDLAAALERAVAREKSFDPLLAAHVASEVAAGLDYAHRLRDEKGGALGLVHRDVTPRNILLSLDGEVKVTDFGVAVLGSDTKEKRRGTLQYMSPEQARGEPVDGRADVFSLGLVLHELLGGERVYRGGKEEILEQARSAKVPRLGGEVPPVLVEAVSRATAERREDRFATARAMQRELDAWVVAERGRRGEDDPLDQALSSFLAALFPDWSERSQEDSLKGTVGNAGTGTMQSVAETVGLDPETTSRVQVLTGVRAARQTRPPSSEAPASRRGRTVAFVSGALVAAAAVAIALGIMSARGGRADPRSPAAAPAPPEPVAAKVMVPPLAPAEPVVEEPEPEPADPEPIAETEPPPPARPDRKTGGNPAATREPKKTGTLDLNAVPWAYVSINGGPEEETPIKARTLPAGKHKVRIRNPVLERHREMTIEISPGETSKYVVDLRQ
ncbi:MAG TPA: serine/threonine-protein kinase [Kofleriaceae bacterium]